MTVQELLRRVDPAVSMGGVANRSPTAREGPSFAHLVERYRQQDTGVRFSAHALERLTERAIELSPTDLEMLRGAIDQLARKGARDSLVLHPRAAVVVNVPNRTVVTAVDAETMRERVFTQIDSALILR
jgi:flagellar operon protein